MAESDFSWTDKDGVIISRVEATAVYTNLVGNIVIRQEDGLGNDDQIFVIPRDQVSTLIAVLQAEIAD